MMKRFFMLLILWTAPAYATPVVADLSNYEIMVDSRFNGTKLFLFGARNDAGDIVVVIRGPIMDYVVRKKEKIAGIWINNARLKLFSIPDYYVVAASKPLNEIEQANMFKILRIGYDNLFQTNEFTQAFLNYQRDRRHYLKDPLQLTFMGETLFKTTIDFPDNIPPGQYIAEIYLLSDGDVVGTQSIPITVEKVGIDAFLYVYAHEHPALYGISAVILALCAGWFAGRIFEKRFV
jgi:uncharacterized protein (TIGR02186 family)